MPFSLGSPRDIATQGLNFPLNSFNVSTQGLLVSTDIVTADIILGGSAGVNISIQQVSSGGIILDGAAGLASSLNHIATGGIVFDGVGVVNFGSNQVADGGITFDGDGALQVTYNITADGGLIFNGEAGTTANLVGIRPVGGGGPYPGPAWNVIPNIQQFYHVPKHLEHLYYPWSKARPVQITITFNDKEFERNYLRDPERYGEILISEILSRSDNRGKISITNLTRGQNEKLEVSDIKSENKRYSFDIKIVDEDNDDE